MASEYELSEISEAHCYLFYDHDRVDITRPFDASTEPISHFLHEEEISPQQIGDLEREFAPEIPAEVAAQRQLARRMKLRTAVDGRRKMHRSAGRLSLKGIAFAADS